ncbi:hypothetical protein D3C71_1461630 [compost metagenome]
MEEHGSAHQDANGARHEHPLVADPVAQDAEQRHGEQRNGGTPDRGVQHDRARDAQSARGIGQRERHHRVEPGHFGQPGAHHHQQGAAMLLQHLGHGHFDLGALLLHLFEVRRFGHLDPDEPAHQQQDHAGQERQAPAPRQHVGFGQRRHGAHCQG